MIRQLNLGTVTNQLQGDDSLCLTMKNTVNDSNPMVIKAEDCTMKKKVMCKLEIPKAIETSLPPKFPCISVNQRVTRKNKRDVESVSERRQKEPTDAKCKQYHQTQRIFFK